MPGSESKYVTLCGLYDLLENELSIEYIVREDEEIMEKRQTRDYTGKRKLESGPACPK